jgi:hypothetical protein
MSRKPKQAVLTQLLLDAATLLAAPTNRFGKPEYFGNEELRAARERIRELSVKHCLTPSSTVAEQASKVIRFLVQS